MSHLTPKEQQALQEFKSQLTKKFGSDLVVLKLFGSKARGDFRKESDLDVFIVLNNLKEEDKNWIGNLSFELSLKYSVFISELIFPKAKWQEYQTKRFSLARNVEGEGVRI